jgi:hypothetical protein
LSATESGDGIVDLPGAEGVAAFAVAAANLGLGGAITASADTGWASPPIALGVCQTDTATGACRTEIASTVRSQVGAGDMPSFAVFVQGQGAVPFDPATSRIVVRFKDDDGVERGATSVAVRTR